MLGGVTRQGGGGGGVVSRRLANSYTRTYCTYYYKNGPNQSVKYARILKMGNDPLDPSSHVQSES